MTQQNRTEITGNKRAKLSGKKERASLTLMPKILNQLTLERTRTETTPAKLLQNCGSVIPDGLLAHTISNWLNGRVKNVRKLQLDFVLSEYRKLPDGGHMITLTKELLSELNAEIEYTGCGPSQIIRLAKKPLPKGLNSSLISKWRSGKMTSAKRAQWDHVITALATLRTFRNKN